METFSALLALCAGNSPVTVNSPHKGQWHGALMFSLICAWIDGCVNSHKAGDLRRHHTHFDTIVMYSIIFTMSQTCIMSTHVEVCLCRGWSNLHEPSNLIIPTAGTSWKQEIWMWLMDVINIKERFVSVIGTGFSLTFRDLSKICCRNLCVAEIISLWEFQAETMYVCPKYRFGHTYKVSAWNSQHKCDFWHSIFSRDYLKSSRNVSETTPVFWSRYYTENTWSSLSSTGHNDVIT